MSENSYTESTKSKIEYRATELKRIKFQLALRKIA